MLDGKAQDAAIKPAPAGRRKIVLATSIAETSITIDGVRVVIDSGLSRVPKYEPATGLTRLETVRVSKASADQRAGRAGRTQSGIAIRLWRAEQTAALPAFTPPEILQADLSGMMLDCAAFGVADPATLRFLDRRQAQPSPKRGRCCSISTPSTKLAALPGPARRCAGWRCRRGSRIWSPRRRRPGGSMMQHSLPCFSRNAASAAIARISTAVCRGSAPKDRHARTLPENWRRGLQAKRDLYPPPCGEGRRWTKRSEVHETGWG